GGVGAHALVGRATEQRRLAVRDRDGLGAAGAVAGVIQPLSLHDALPIWIRIVQWFAVAAHPVDAGGPAVVGPRRQPRVDHRRTRGGERAYALLARAAEQRRLAVGDRDGLGAAGAVAGLLQRRPGDGRAAD